MEQDPPLQKQKLHFVIKKDDPTYLTSLSVFMGTSHMPGWDSPGQGLTLQLWGILYSKEYGQDGDSVGMEES